MKFTLTVFWSLVRKTGKKGEENSGYTERMEYQRKGSSGHA